MSLRADIVGAVMAGGKSSRMGTEKALLPLGDRPMISHVISTLSAIFSEVIVCGADPARFEFLGVPVIQDIFQGCGPLAGIHAALTHSAHRPVFVLSCDMPFVPPALVRHILDHPATLQTRIATTGGILQTLCGLYGQECLPIVDEDLRGGKYSILKMLEKVVHEAVEISNSLPFYDEYMLSNVNRPEDYEAIRGKVKKVVG